MTKAVTKPERRPEVLLVEDNLGDVKLIRLAFSEAGISAPLRVVTDGEQALAYLRRKPPFEQVRQPALVLLDLNLPRMDGREVLKTLKSDPDLKRIPVCVLTTSGDELDIVESYNLHANSYIQKPVLMMDLVSVVSRIHNYWLGIVDLPAEYQYA